jgi:hypothetical protein
MAICRSRGATNHAVLGSAELKVEATVHAAGERRKMLWTCLMLSRRSVSAQCANLRSRKVGDRRKLFRPGNLSGGYNRQDRGLQDRRRRGTLDSERVGRVVAFTSRR